MSDDRQDSTYLLKTVEKLEKTVDKVDEKVESIDRSLVRMVERFDAHITQDEEMYQEFKRMVNILDETSKDVQHHIKRTDLLQENISLLEAFLKKADERLSTIERHKIEERAIKEYRAGLFWKWSKIFSVLAAIVSAVYTIIKIQAGS